MGEKNTGGLPWFPDKTTDKLVAITSTSLRAIRREQQPKRLFRARTTELRSGILCTTLEADLLIAAVNTMAEMKKVSDFQLLDSISTETSKVYRAQYHYSKETRE